MYPPSPQPSIANSNIWLMTLSFMTASILQDHKLLERIPTLMAINIIKHILKEINTLPPNLTTTQVNCINKGKELINLLLLGASGDGAGVVSHYDIIVAVSNITQDNLIASLLTLVRSYQTSMDTFWVVRFPKAYIGLWKSLSTNWVKGVVI